jgi:hypothetical protein
MVIWDGGRSSLFPLRIATVGCRSSADQIRSRIHIAGGRLHSPPLTLFAIMYATLHNNNHFKYQTPQNCNHLSYLFSRCHVFCSFTLPIRFHFPIFVNKDPFPPESLCFNDCLAGMDSGKVCGEEGGVGGVKWVVLVWIVRWLDFRTCVEEECVFVDGRFIGEFFGLKVVCEGCVVIFLVFEGDIMLSLVEESLEFLVGMPYVCFLLLIRERIYWIKQLTRLHLRLIFQLFASRGK